MTEAEKEAIERAKFLVSIPTYLEKEMCKNLLNYIDKLQKENEELKEKNIILEGNKIGYKLAIQELKEENKKIDKAADNMNGMIRNI